MEKSKEEIKQELVEFFTSGKRVGFEDLTDEYFEAALKLSLEEKPLATDSKGPKI